MPNANDILVSVAYGHADKISCGRRFNDGD
jgi:hypothetical protein